MTMTLSRFWSPFVASISSQPCIPVRATNVHVLHSPIQFYNTLLAMINRAKHRIFLSSLYIGTSESHLLQTLHDSLASNHRLHLHLNLDLLRSTRPGPASTASLLVPLITSFPDRVHVRLFRSPMLKGVLANLVPRRFDEGWGTWHAKVYGADDEVMISGANLNQSYFTNRQDRYLHFTSSPALANYCFDFLRLFAQLSYRLLPDATPHTPFTLHWSNPHVAPTETERVAERAVDQFHSTQPHASGEHASDTLVFPMVQAGHFDVREEERCITRLFSHLARAQDDAIVDLTSGYFALHRPYQDLLINSPASSRIIAAGPKANGFYGSKGVSGRIPEGYTLLEKHFWRKVLRADRAWDDGKASGIELREWEKVDWTYHAKGIWYRPTSSSPPHLTLFGSTNLNSRSANLDTELSFLLLTTASALQTQLDAEVHHLRRHSRKVGEEDWRTNERRVRWGTKALVAAGVEGML